MAENMHCSAAEVGQRVDMAELVDWLGYYRHKRAHEDARREQAQLARATERQQKLARRGNGRKRH